VRAMVGQALWFALFGLASALPSEDSVDRAFGLLGFCNERTLKGRYLWTSDGVGVLTIPSVEGPTGAFSISAETYFDGKGKSLTQFDARSADGQASTGPLARFNVWSDVEVFKNCSGNTAGTVIEYVFEPFAPNAVAPGDGFLSALKLDPSGAFNVFTLYDSSNILTSSAKADRVRGPEPVNFMPPPISDCDSPSSCFNRYVGKTCTSNNDCLTTCFPSCAMQCVPVFPPGGEPSDCDTIECTCEGE